MAPAYDQCMLSPTITDSRHADTQICSPQSSQRGDGITTTYPKLDETKLTTPIGRVGSVYVRSRDAQHGSTIQIPVSQLG